MWPLAGQKASDHSTIARFRTGFLADACENLFYHMVRRLEKSGELSKETVHKATDLRKMKKTEFQTGYQQAGKHGI